MKRTLLIEDCEDQRMMIELALSNQGLKVDSVASAPEAIDRLKAQHYNLIVCDLRLPEVDGIEFVRRMRGMPGCNHDVPVVLLTAGSTDRAAEAKAAGVAAILHKDKLHVLAARIKALIPHQKGEVE
jgi:CheY-like chemotaxis protein